MSPKNFPPHIVDEGASYQADKMIWRQKPLSKEEIEAIYCEVFCLEEGSKPTTLAYEFVKVIEERHGIK